METEYNRRRVVVTGATGMVGSNLVATLIQKGYEDITVVIRSESSLVKLHHTLDLYSIGEWFDKINKVKCNLKDVTGLAECFKESDVVFNCAAEVTFRHDTAQQLISNNVQAAYGVASAASEAKVGLLVHVSSIAALGSRKAPEMITESVFMENISGKSAYSISKFYSEGEIWKAYYGGLKCIIVNPGIILGPGDWHGTGSASIFGKMDKGVPFYTEGVIGYVGVKDVAEAMIILSMQENTIGERFILCSENLSYKEFMSDVAESIGKPVPRFNISDKALNIISKLLIFASNMGINFPLTPDIIKSLVDKVYYDGSKITNFTKFKYTPIKEVINEIGEIYKAEKPKK